MPRYKNYDGDFVAALLDFEVDMEWCKYCDDPCDYLGDARKDAFCFAVWLEEAEDDKRA